MIGHVLGGLGRMIVLNGVIPALVRLMQVEQEAGGIVGVLHRVQHIGKIVEPFHVPFGVDLHAADIDGMPRGRDSRLEMAHGGFAAVEEQALAAVSQCPCPGHELSGDRLAAGLDPRNALKQSFWNAVLRLGAARLGKADILQ